MDDEGHSKKSKKWKNDAVLVILLLILGMIAGMWVYPQVESFVNPNRANIVEQVRVLETQNQLLKGQVDCLVENIQTGQSGSAVETCT